jgi:hypothetical protein
MPVTIVFSTGRVAEFSTATDTHYRGGTLRVLSADGKAIAAFDAEGVTSVTINGKKIEWPPRQPTTA